MREVSKDFKKCINSAQGACGLRLCALLSVSCLVTFSQQERHQSCRSAVRGGSKEGRRKEGEATSTAKEQKSQSATGERWNPELRQMLQSYIHPSMSRTRSALHSHWCRVRGGTPEKQPKNKPAAKRQLQNEEATSCLHLTVGRMDPPLQIRNSSAGLRVESAHKHKISLLVFDCRRTTATLPNRKVLPNSALSFVLTMTT